MEWESSPYGTVEVAVLAGIFRLTVEYNGMADKSYNGPRVKASFSGQTRLKNMQESFADAKQAIIEVAKRRLVLAVEELGGKVAWEGE